ncbi:hypothetical protein B0H14DRAFT_2949548 [Mycena olivaceomarginata]|nr:hypothetical protein B0H14DRAFT_2949548 [Mycena olivaceomarginata]
MNTSSNAESPGARTLFAHRSITNVIPMTAFVVAAVFVPHTPHPPTLTYCCLTINVKDLQYLYLLSFPFCGLGFYAFSVASLSPSNTLTMGTLILTPSSIIIMELILNMLSFDFIFLLRLTDEEIAERAPLIFVPYFVPHFFNLQVCSASLLLSGFDAGPSLEFAVSAHRRTLLTNTSSYFKAELEDTNL